MACFDAKYHTMTLDRFKVSMIFKKPNKATNGQIVAIKISTKNLFSHKLDPKCSLLYITTCIKPECKKGTAK